MMTAVNNINVISTTATLADVIAVFIIRLGFNYNYESCSNFS